MFAAKSLDAPADRATVEILRGARELADAHTF